MSKTPRSLIQYPGRVDSTPQGTGSKFLVEWCTSTDVDGFSFKLDGAQRLNNVYNTPVVLARLGECGVRDLPGAHSLSVQPANSSDTKASWHAFSFPATTLEDLGHNQGGTMSTNWATHIQLAPTQGQPRIVMYATRGDKVSSRQLIHFQWCRPSMPRTVLRGTN